MSGKVFSLNQILHLPDEHSGPQCNNLLWPHLHGVGVGVAGRERQESVVTHHLACHPDRERGFTHTALGPSFGSSLTQGTCQGMLVILQGGWCGEQGRR